jgi:hypothetical protein
MIRVFFESVAVFVAGLFIWPQVLIQAFTVAEPAALAAGLSAFGAVFFARARFDLMRGP